ncbi:alpha/beta hydrolase [Arthrobacter sp.]|uniref:alpha/beta hydrolase n=2 Tax=Arthrobacter sp. TaxID=1667 RepID=UPI0028116493|nr:alpha/beta hydrolase [Arthrobacter sp.]
MPISVPSNLTFIPARDGEDTPRPAILVLPGGGYGQTSAHEGEPVAEWLAGLGVHAFVLRYRVAPHQHPAPLSDAKEAMLWIRGGEHGIAVDADRVGVLGFSAGGHLAATLSTDTPCGDPHLDVTGAIPDLSVLCYPVVSFIDAVHQGSIDNLLGGSPSSDLLQRMSADLNVTSTTPPAFLWHTADDEPVPVENTFAYARALVRNNVPVEVHVFPHGAHGLGLGEGEAGPDEWTVLCGKWLNRHGWAHPGLPIS